MKTKQFITGMLSILVMYGFTLTFVGCNSDDDDNDPSTVAYRVAEKLYTDVYGSNLYEDKDLYNYMDKRLIEVIDLDKEEGVWEENRKTEYDRKYEKAEEARGMSYQIKHDAERLAKDFSLIAQMGDDPNVGVHLATYSKKFFRVLCSINESMGEYEQTYSDHVSVLSELVSPSGDTTFDEKEIYVLMVELIDSRLGKLIFYQRIPEKLDLAKPVLSQILYS